MDGFEAVKESGLDDDARGAFARDVIDGLSRPAKAIPCKWFYDVRGSELFEEITRLEEYYPTRTELALLTDIAPELGARLPTAAWVVEFGSGSSRKSDLLLDALPAPHGYVPIDVAADYLEAAARALQTRQPHLEVRPIAADFTAAIELPDELAAAPKVGFFPGSTIGNFEPPLAARFLARARAMLGAGAYMVIGVDLKKDVGRLLDAYDDARGVTADFNLNLLDRINRELGGSFDRRRFRHRVRYDTGEGRVEMHLESTEAQTVIVDGQRFAFAEGETIHTENSYKYSLRGFTEVAATAGWHGLRRWTDDEDLFSIHLLRAA